MGSEGEYTDHVPPSVVGLTMGGRDTPIILLDTDYGIVHWFECPGEVQAGTSREQVLDDAYDVWGDDEEEADWRGSSGTWAIGDFFEVLKEHFMNLTFVPITQRHVLHVYPHKPDDSAAMLARAKEIYGEHGWPDLDRYRKEECMEAVTRCWDTMS